MSDNNPQKENFLDRLENLEVGELKEPKPKSYQKTQEDERHSILLVEDFVLQDGEIITEDEATTKNEVSVREE